jgi:hypothetical protein
MLNLVWLAENFTVNLCGVSLVNANSYGLLQLLLIPRVVVLWLTLFFSIIVIPSS